MHRNNLVPIVSAPIASKVGEEKSSLLKISKRQLITPLGYNYFVFSSNKFVSSLLSFSSGVSKKKACGISDNRSPSQEITMTKELEAKQQKYTSRKLVFRVFVDVLSSFI